MIIKIMIAYNMAWDVIKNLLRRCDLVTAWTIIIIINVVRF